MTITVLGSAGTSTYASSTKVSTQTVALTRAMAAGTTLVVAAVFEGTGGAAANITTVSAPGSGNSGVGNVARISGSTRCVALATLPVNTALNIGDLVTINIDETRWRWAISLTAVQGLLATPADQTSSNDSTGTAMDGGSTSTTTQAVELVVGAFATGPAETTTAGSGYTLGDTVATAFGSGDHKLTVVYKTLSATGVQSAVATENTSGAWAGVTLTLKSAVTQTLRPSSDSLTTGWAKTPSGAASYAICVNDSSDTTFVTSPNNPSSGYIEFNLPTPSPLPTAGNAAVLSARLRANSFTTATGKCSLYMGATLIKENTFTLSSGFVEYDLTLTSADTAAANTANAAWNTLKVRVYPVAS